MKNALDVLDTSGHVRITWDPTDPAEVEEAMRAVSDLKAKGYSFFDVVGEKDGVLDVKRTEEPVKKGKPGRKPKRTVATRPMAGG